MRRGTTSTGFAYEYDEARLDDMRLLDQLIVITDEDAGEIDQILAVSRAILMLLGAQGKAELYEHIGQSHDGRVPARELTRELGEIFRGEDHEDRRAEKN